MALLKYFRPVDELCTPLSSIVPPEKNYHPQKLVPMKVKTNKALFQKHETLNPRKFVRLQ